MAIFIYIKLASLKAKGRWRIIAATKRRGIFFPNLRKASAPAVTWPEGAIWCIFACIASAVIEYLDISWAAFPSGMNSMALNQSSFCSSLIDRMQNSHLSSKISLPRVGCMKKWWAQRDLNPRPNDYESSALTTELWALLVFERAQCALRKALGQRKIKSLTEIQR